MIYLNMMFLYKAFALKYKINEQRSAKGKT